MDSGDIIESSKTIINDDDTVGTLHDRLSIMGRDLLLKTLPSIVNHTNKRIKQNELEVTFGFNIKREEELINFNKSRREVFNKIRGLNPNPGGYFLLNEKIVKVYKVEEICNNNYQDKINGERVKIDKNSFFIKVVDGLIRVLEIKLEGKKRMSVREFLNGNQEDLLGIIVNKGVTYEEERK